MKKINNYSSQYKIISHNFAHNFPEQLHNQNQNHGKNTTKAKPYLHKKTLSKNRQEYINNISASGFKQFHT